MTMAKRATRLAAWLQDWDLIVLLVVVLADYRLFKGSSVASFTVYELFAWGYCTPFIIGRLLEQRRSLPHLYTRLLYPLACYLAWIMLASLFALLARQHSDVLQQAKNILPALPLAVFLGIRLRRPETVARLANLYVLYCVAACVLALAQLTHGGPYVRPWNENNDFKLDYSGNLAGRVVLGFSGTPNELAVVVLPGVMLSAMQLLAELRQGLRPRLITLACCLATAGVFLLAQSRGAVVWLLFGLTFMATPMRRSTSFALKFSVVAGLIFVVAAYGMRADPGGAAAVDNTVVGRYQLWRTSLDAMTSDPYVAILGDGGPYVQIWSWRNAGWEFPDAHNGWIDQALFFGVPALLLYLLIWRAFFRITDRAARSASMPPRALILLDGIRGSVLSLMGLYFFEPVAHSVFPVSQLFLLMSCGVGLVSLSAEREEKQALLF